MKGHWEQEKQAIDAIRCLKEELETLRTQVERETDLSAAAEIRYGRIPELERASKRPLRISTNSRATERC